MNDIRCLSTCLLIIYYNILVSSQKVDIFFKYLITISYLTIKILTLDSNIN